MSHNILAAVRDFRESWYNLRLQFESQLEENGVSLHKIAEWVHLEFDVAEGVFVNKCLSVSDPTMLTWLAFQELWGQLGQKMSSKCPLICACCGTEIEETAQDNTPPCPTCNSTVFTRQH